jgi:Undecaprenyl-phosphate glucose phosphotransferase
MLKKYHQTIGGLFRGVDACVIGASWLLSYWMRFNLPLIQVTKGFPEFSTYSSLTPLVIVLWLGVFSSMGVYRPRGMLRRTHEVQLILKAHLTALVLFITLSTFISEYRYSRGVMIYFGALGAFALVAERLGLRNLIRAARAKGVSQRKVLIFGEGRSLETLVARLRKFPELGLRPLGVVVHESSSAREVSGLPVLGHLDQAISLLREHGADQALIALPREQAAQVDRLLNLFRNETIDIQIVPDLHDYIALGCEVEDFDGVPIVNLNDSPLDGWGALAKRATDFVLAAIALLVLSPVLLLIALAVKLTSRGPILYGQERMGLDGRTFHMLKFRSMRVDAEKETGAVWAQPGDDRRTPIGAFLRATSLDELPQFWNVLLGDMSLVGPRPERPVFVDQFKGEIPNYMLRHKVKAGITGWAQVNGWRGNTSLESRIQCDLYYIRNWSYSLDWKILFLTLWKGFVNKNAY